MAGFLGRKPATALVKQEGNDRDYFTRVQDCDLPMSEKPM